MKEYIDREALITRLQKVCVTDDTFGMGVQTGTEHAINCIKEAPAADVVEVVRCEDCKRCELRYPAKAIGEEAIEGYYCYPNQKYVKSNDFCSYGERKGGEG